MNFNKVIHGDCLQVMRGMPSDSVDLVYMDPPFNSGRDYKKFGGEFSDKFKSMRHYIDYIRERVVGCGRVLKPGGSLYLHCDDAAVHYLKVMLDSALNLKFRNHIVWKRTTAKNQAFMQRFGRIADHILFYGAPINPDAVMLPLTEKQQKRTMEDDRGLYRCDPLMGQETRNGESGQVWKGVDPNLKNKHWLVPKTGKYAAHIDKIIPGYSGVKSVIARLDLLESHGFIKWGDAGPKLKVYEYEGQGMVPGDIWSDISNLKIKGPEYKDYPTQKPLELLDRIVKASSTEGDVVLDPFCGTGTALEAAMNLGRKFVGIDMNADACRLAAARVGIDYEECNG